jgi:hypothetical protein
MMKPIKLITLLSSVILISCTMFKPNRKALGTLQGHVYKLSGNQMPGPGRVKGKGRGVSRQLCIYAPTKSEQTSGHMPLFTHINTPLVAHVQTDSTGYFTVKLPAGKYSVFIQETGGLFAAEADGEGHLNPVLITAGQTLNRNFTITLQAAF